MFCFLLPDGLGRAALCEALSLVDDGSAVIEIGRPETGATCVISAETDGALVAVLPLVRAPWSASDLLPTLVDAATRLGGRLVPTPPLPDLADPIAAWGAAHGEACRTLAESCAAGGLPPPPHLTTEALTALHGWLLACAGAPEARTLPTVLVVDPRDGAPAIPAVRLSPVMPPLSVLFDPNAPDEPADAETPRLYTRADLADTATARADGMLVVDVPRARERLRACTGIDLERARFVSPVEVIDAESLAP